MKSNKKYILLNKIYKWIKNNLIKNLIISIKNIQIIIK